MQPPTTFPPPSINNPPPPRRASPEASVTLRYHHSTRVTPLQASGGFAPPKCSHETSSFRRVSSNESHETVQSDPKKWFDQANQHPTATFDTSAMDVDAPFFQKESDLSSADKPSSDQPLEASKLDQARSSSADDYRGVIDDLTVEIQKLKGELKRYKQRGPEMLRKQQLFEVRFHGLPRRKRRELEATLRDFAASLGNSSGSSSQRKTSSRRATRDGVCSGSGSGTLSMSKQASSSSGYNARPVDSAYASMSTAANSTGTSLCRLHATSSRARSADKKVESYLRDIPEGLYPRHIAMTEKEKKKLVVRRLEQIFTGKLAGHHARRSQTIRDPGSVSGPWASAPATAIAPSPAPLTTLIPVSASISATAPVPAPAPAPAPTPAVIETQISSQINQASREARILPLDHPSEKTGKKSGSQDMAHTALTWASHSNADQTDTGGNHGNHNNNGSGKNSGPDSRTNLSPLRPPPPEQRPTRLKDLDPDRVQIPSENMEYIRHLGLVPPELTPQASGRLDQDVHPDAEGWVYLNLLCNMAQLHIMNVTPDFVRTAVTELSTKFQLSPGGRKIRWRGGIEGTRFNSDNSGNHSQRSPETEDADLSKNAEGKRRKIGRSAGDGGQSRKSGVSAGRKSSKLRPQASCPSDKFHYKPLFVRKGWPNEQSSMDDDEDVDDDSLSSLGPVEESNHGESRWNESLSAASNRRKRRHNGGIIYYSGAPFCTDLCGDAGDGSSPKTCMLSSGRTRAYPPTAYSQPAVTRSDPGSPMEKNSPSDAESPHNPRWKMVGDSDAAGSNGDGVWDDHFEWETRWSDAQQCVGAIPPLEPCGLGNILPEDHFRMICVTKRRKYDAEMVGGKRVRLYSPEEEGRKSTLVRPCRAMLSRQRMMGSRGGLDIEYVSSHVQRLEPEPLPAPATFFPPLSVDSWSEGEEDEDGDEREKEEEWTTSGADDELAPSEEGISRRGSLHESDGQRCASLSSDEV